MNSRPRGQTSPVLMAMLGLLVAGATAGLAAGGLPGWVVGGGWCHVDVRVADRLLPE